MGQHARQGVGMPGWASCVLQVQLLYEYLRSSLNFEWWKCQEALLGAYGSRWWCLMPVRLCAHVRANGRPAVGANPP